jgi:HD superfamily phosphodiesterase
MVDLQVPDSRLARQAEELARTACPPFLTNHCFRSHAWAVALAERDGIRFDAELLYVAALLHDVGLIPEFDTGRCFEVDGAAAAADLAAAAGWAEERRDALAEAIRLHVALEEELGEGPEAYLLWHATGLDVVGHRLHDLDRRTIGSVIARYPRLDFERGFTDLLRDQAARKPNCWAADAIKSGIAERSDAAPFEGENRPEASAVRGRS